MIRNDRSHCTNNFAFKNKEGKSARTHQDRNLACPVQSRASAYLRILCASQMAGRGAFLSRAVENAISFHRKEMRVLSRVSLTKACTNPSQSLTFLSRETYSAGRAGGWGAGRFDILASADSNKKRWTSNTRGPRARGSRRGP
ncbi:hypothetical protein EVAR_48073_1 [Eumeta japonica]|uniref:Uncharacterized protein n=1 Tax=Eumeta variegata TaxID=151549 RepID=A0A4C1XA32_EUMVA|nr:hypothetical protein EVAR_48073_1 [Eumeta japonica]